MKLNSSILKEIDCRLETVLPIDEKSYKKIFYSSVIRRKEIVIGQWTVEKLTNNDHQTKML
jgi:hypothetical protein